MINRRIAQVCVTEALIREVAPILFNVLTAIEEQKKIGCNLRFLLQSHKNSLKLDINQEVERRKLDFPSDWESDEILSFLTEQIKDILYGGALNTLCRGIDDFICLRIELLPSSLAISTLYSRTEFIQINTGVKQNKRTKYTISGDNERSVLLDNVFELVKDLLSIGFSRFQAKQQGQLAICYFPDIFIYRDRLTSKERYELRDYLSLGEEKISTELPEVYTLIETIRDFVQNQNIQDTNRGDYELKIDISASNLDISSVYHDSQQY